METAGIKDIKNNLSRYLKQVKSGEEVIITERGRPIARIIREHPAGTSLHLALAPLIEQGVVTMPTLGPAKTTMTPLRAPGKPASEMVLEDRR
ncbi:MAG: type II toxin-antitoxin system prevent-host-death family antitoxin [Desulfosudaceae bacterium]